ncbi:hypothetical protein ASG25_10520 [Rhizobium sp. Leaf384]|uniref:DUF6894 family protein n=1 Tax=Rhizobium sp. Leaf384 TaxID=1736358 RepID=UPI00071276C7|nr:hypothetical protein [Rhizobium sp. Leaf384]KQS79014.1 hypothetical protein ASG25_10520 [Rhizobium sp. Leaf384]
MSDVRYFLSLHETGGLVADNEGKSFGSQADAHDYAIQSMRDMISESLRTGEAVAIRSIEIADEYGVVVDEVSQADAIDGIVDR